MAVKARPFTDALELSSSPLPASGTVRGDIYELGLLGRRIVLRTELVSHDDDGVYALLAEGQYVVDDWTIEVAPDYEPDMPPGGEISVTLGVEASSPPHSADIILVAPRMVPSVSVYLDADGWMNDCASSGFSRAEETPQKPN